MAGAPIENTNAEKWTLEEAKALFESCLVTAKDKKLDCNDFMGEVAQENGTYLTQLDYLKDKFPELNKTYRAIKNHCESNCFRNGKKGKIVASLAIMNLKSNHGWTDRVDNTSKGKEITSVTRTIVDESENKDS
jgi:hypothetical protein